VLALAVAAAGALLAVASILFTAFGTGGDGTMRVQSASMEPTYQPGSLVAVHSSDGTAVRRGQVVVFSAHDWGMDQVYMQRVIAVGGDRVVIDRTGTLSVNGTPLHESYIAAGSDMRSVPVDVTVPAGRLFLLGDHRNDSLDSRYHQGDYAGTIPRTAVVGTVSPHRTAPSPDRLWTWIGAAVVVAGLGAAGVATAVRHRATPAPTRPSGPA
jgi:signal peptidase I